MEVEPKNVITRYRDSQNQWWRVDKEIQWPEKNEIWDVFFDKKGTKIRVGDDDGYIHTWDRVDGTYLGKRHADDFVLTKPSDESSDESSDFEPGFTHGKYGQIFHSTSGKEELVWLNVLWRKFVHLDTSESKEMMVLSKFNQPIAYVWDREANKEACQLDHQNNIKQLSLDDAGKIKTLTDDNIFRIWNGKTGEELLKIIFDNDVQSVSFNAIDTEIVIATKDGKIQILVKEVDK
jgi:WD40 repeat protein